ncbi:MAG: hypothetical protein OSB69_15005 [Alphaproteobacteria bacterium]|nr:hypothetical protein [Alphaproteobacteria bacterium]
MTKFTGHDWGAKTPTAYFVVKVARTGTSIPIVSFKGKVDALLAKFEKFPIVKALHAGGYLRSCSSAGGNQYYVTVSTENAEDKGLANGKLVYGNF